VAERATVQGFLHLVSDNGVEERFTFCLHEPDTHGRRTLVAWTPGALVPLVIDGWADGLLGGLVAHMEHFGMLPPGRKDNGHATGEGVAAGS
jgi:hypothetical protein